MTIHIDIELIDDDIRLLDFETKLNNSFFLKSREDLIIKAGKFKIINTGLKIGLSEGLELDIISNPNLIDTDLIIALDNPGLCDEGYKDEYKVTLINLGTKDFIINKYDKIAKCKILPVYKAKFNIKRI